jgi:hypothetical protein
MTQLVSLLGAGGFFAVTFGCLLAASRRRPGQREIHR